MWLDLSTIVNVLRMPADVKRISERWTPQQNEQHCNLYISVDILYPWAIYYLYVLKAIIDLPCDRSWFKKHDYPYDENQANHDMTLILLFCSAPTDLCHNNAASQGP